MKKIKYQTPQQLEALKFIAKEMDFGVSLTVTASLNEFINFYILLRDNKKFFRQRIKQLVNEIDKKVTIQRTNIMSEMKNKKFFFDYSDRVIDLADEHTSLFRNSLKKHLNDGGCKDSELIAECEVTRLLFSIAVDHYDLTMEYGKEHFKCTMVHDFGEFNLLSIKQKFEKLCDYLYATQSFVELNTEENERLYKIMCKGFLRGEYVSECLKTAKKENPNLKFNDVKLVEKDLGY